MRDIIITRRALLALAAGAALIGWGTALGVAHPIGKKGAHRPPAPSRPPPRLVVLDPGHGGVDPGAISPHGLYEKNITLAVARELARQLQAAGHYRAVLTRNRDVYVPLRERVSRARFLPADLLLSIHADALPDRGLRGFSVYTLSDQASDKETAALAERENRDKFVAGLKLSRQPREIGAILLDLARRQTNNRSLTLARTVVAELGRVVPLLEKPHRSAGFVVLMAPDVPSALVELGCLSNPQDERLLPQHAYQLRLAQGLLRAIEDYFAEVVRA
jgi:N-acetylmuramoyl-L-alanine amidase